MNYNAESSVENIENQFAGCAPVTVGNDLHRIDRGHVIELATNAGFVLEAESDYLAHANDDRTGLAFGPEISGKTDQFALRFRKPE